MPMIRCITIIVSDTGSCCKTRLTVDISVATKTPQETAPVLGRGALCADSMGLGKTLTMLALILATKSDTPVDHSNATLIGWYSHFLDVRETLTSHSRSSFRDVELGEADRRPC